MHIFLADVASRKVRPLTSGRYDEHSIAWSPDGSALAFLSDREPDPDMFFNYDVFVADVRTGAVRQITATKSNEYRPVWSPDGKTLAYEGLKRADDVVRDELGRHARVDRRRRDGTAA